MGIMETIGYNKYPKQGQFLGKRTKVIFNYQDDEIFGLIVRDDMEYPFRTIICLDDGRFILATECQFSPIP